MLRLLRHPFGQSESSAAKAEKQPNMPSSSFTHHRTSSSTNGFEYHSSYSSSHGTNATTDGTAYSALSLTESPDSPVHTSKPFGPMFSQRPRANTANTARSSSFGGLERVKEQYATSRSQAYRVLGSNFGGYAFDTSITGLLEWIRDERLIRLPHKGGSWDRVLIAAQHFAEQVHRFNIAIESFASEINAATNLVFGQCLLLLELGSENAPALETVFNLFYQFGLELSPLLKRVDIITSSRLISDNLSKAFSELLSIVTGVAITFYQIVHGQSSSTNIDIFTAFGSTIESFRQRVAQCSQDMWSVSLTSSGLKESHSLEALHTWLAPQDTVLAFLASHNINLATRPEQFTCTWFQTHLTNFLRNGENTLVVEGRPGSGKTILANWTVDRLQRPIGRKLFSPLSFSFNSSIRTQATSVALLKTLLWQILSQRIGDILLYGALSEAYNESKDSNTGNKNEEILWSVLEKVLHSICEDETNALVIVVDGLDEISGPRQHTHAVVNRLHELAGKIPALRLIRFSQPLEISQNKSEYVNLSMENMLDDIRTIVRRELGEHKFFTEKDDITQESIINKLAVAADGSVLWASLATQYVGLSKVHSFDDVLQTIVSSPKTVPDIVERLVSSLNLGHEALSLLSIVLAAERPLLLSEVEILLQAQPNRLEMNEKNIDIRGLVKAVDVFAITGEGMITLRHNAIKEALTSLSDKSKDLWLIKDRQRDLVTRIFIHAKTSLREDQEPTLDSLDLSRVQLPSSSRQLLEYTVRYWIDHFKQSSLLKRGSDLDVPKDFVNIFPGTVTLALLEEACWRPQTSPTEASDLHALAYRLRRTLFGKDHACVLQTAIVLAKLYETTLSRLHDAASWYITAIRSASKILGSYHDLVVQLCISLLRVTETLVTKNRSEITNYREETMRLLVTAYTYRYGASSKEVSAVYKQLTELFIFVGETEKTAEFKEKTGSISVDDQSVQQESGDKVSRTLDVTLNKHKHKELIDTFEGSLFAGYQEETAEALTLSLVEGIFSRASDFLSREDYEKAEELYIELWWKLTEHCASVRTLDWHEKKLQLMLAYARFLHSRKRVDEASSVLLFAWKEFEHSEFSMYESIVKLLKEIAVIMKSVKLNTVALSVYQKCWSWYKNVDKSETTAFTEIEEQITTTSMEIIKSSASLSVSESTEITIREVFEHSISSSSEVTHSTFELSKSLTSIYIEQSRYSQAINVLESTMKKGWAALFSASIESITLPSKFSTESIALALRLAECYERNQVLDQAEQIYLRLYRAHRKASKLDNPAVAKYSDAYLEFLKQHGLYDRVIGFYQELLIDHRNFYGADHQKTIALLYVLADTCRTHHLTHRYWTEYYLDIVNVVNKGDLTSHRDGLRALIVVAEHYFETRRSTEALVHFRSIAATFIKFGTQYEQFRDAAVVQSLLEKYYKAMEETKLDVDQHVKILKDLREACFKYYGEKSRVSVTTTSALAEACAKSQEYWFESIRYFESISQHSELVSKQTIERSQSMIKNLYIKQVTSTQSSTTLSNETVEKASSMLYDQYIESRRNHSYTQTKTLMQLKELVGLYHKQQKTDLVLKELKSLTLEIVLNVRTTEELVYVADFLASIFISYDLRRQALEIVRDLKLQAIYHSAPKSSAFHGATIGRSCFAFIAAFEYHVRSDHTLSIAHNIAELVAEHLFYERFVRSIKAKAKLQQVFVHAARLRHILVRNNRFEDFGTIETQLVDFFASTELAVSKAVSRESLRAFVNVVTKYAADHPNVHFKSFVVAASYAAIDQLRILLKQNKDQEALDLATCTFKFLMAHEGLDDPTEIRLGFQLCLMTAGRGEFAHRSSSAKVQGEMLALSQQILGEVFDICKNNNINIARAQLSELNELISLVGEHRDYARLRWLLHTLWTSREGQSSWPQETVLDLGSRLVQAEFSAGNHRSAIRLCEDIVYNIKRVHGARNPRLYSCYSLLAELYTGYADHLLAEAAAARQDTAAVKTAAEQNARLYYKKAIATHETVLKDLVGGADPGDILDDDDDYVTDFSFGARNSAGSVNGHSHSHSHSHSRTYSQTNGYHHINGDSESEPQQREQQALQSPTFSSREEEVEIARRHLRLLKLALQRLGSFPKAQREYENLTQRVHAHYSGSTGSGNAREELRMKDTEWNAAMWKVDGLGLALRQTSASTGTGAGGGGGGGESEGTFRVPARWAICVG